MPKNNNLGPDALYTELERLSLIASDIVAMDDYDLLMDCLQVIETHMNITGHPTKLMFNLLTVFETEINFAREHAHD